MDGNEDNHARQNMPDLKRQIVHVFSYIYIYTWIHIEILTYRDMYTQDRKVEGGLRSWTERHLKAIGRKNMIEYFGENQNSLFSFRC